MTLTKTQLEQIASVFKNDTIADSVELIERRDSGIGVNLYCRYVDVNLNIKQADITDYASW